MLHCLRLGLDEYSELGPSSIVAGLIANTHEHNQSTQPPSSAPATIATRTLCTADDVQRFIAQQRGATVDARVN